MGSHHCLTSSKEFSHAHPARQVATLFVGNATERGITTVLAPGESLHIDWVNATAQDPESLIQSASKSYLDWYMLTQVRQS